MRKKPNKIKQFKADIRDPYMGNTIPIQIDILLDEDGYIIGVRVTNSENLTLDAKHLSDIDVQ